MSLSRFCPIFCLKQLSLKVFRFRSYQGHLNEPPKRLRSEVHGLKVSLIHMKVRNSLKSNLKAASSAVHRAVSQKPAFIALPEYFSVPNNVEHFTSAEKISKETYNETMKFLEKISKEFPNIYILGGTVLEEDHRVFYNTSTLWRNGLLIGKDRKRNPINAEIKAGVSRGDKPA